MENQPMTPPVATPAPAQPTSPPPMAATPPPAPVMPTSKPTSKGWLWASIIALVLVLAYGAVTYFSGIWPFGTMPGASVTPEGTSEWNVYESQELGLSVRYPPTWSLDTTIQCYPDCLLFGNGMYQINIGQGNYDSTDQSVWLSSYFGSTYNPEYAQPFTTAEGIEGVIYSGSESTGGYATVAMLPYPDRSGFPVEVTVPLVVIRAAHIESVAPNPLDSVFRAMASSLRFMAADPTAGWETYRNQQYGFEVAYPIDYRINPYGSLNAAEGEVVRFVQEGPEGTLLPQFSIWLMAISMTPEAWWQSSDSDFIVGTKTYYRTSNIRIGQRDVFNAEPMELGNHIRAFTEGRFLVIFSDISGITDPVPDVIASFRFTE